VAPGAIGPNEVQYAASTDREGSVLVHPPQAGSKLRLRHDGNPVLEWCVGNVVGKPDRRGNLYPAKQRPEQGLDAAVALMMAVGRAMTEDSEPDVGEFFRNPLFA
jgi:hypothetical protein